MNSLILMLKDDSGNTAAEYGLILALVGSAIAIGAVNLGNIIATALDNTSNTITQCTNGPC
jgi:pilus assembly protein Flp/PilA